MFLAALREPEPGKPRHPSEALPVEILSTIFKKALEAPEPCMAVHNTQIRIGSVSKVWRHILLTTPDLWCMLCLGLSPPIDYQHPKPITSPIVQAFHQIITRSKSLPIRVALQTTPLTLEVRLLLNPHLHRIEWLRIKLARAVKPHEPDGSELDFLNLKRLRYFETNFFQFTCHDDLGESSARFADNFQDNITLLKNLPSGNITTLQVNMTGPGPDEVIPLLLQCPVLESLDLDCYHWPGSPEESDEDTYEYDDPTLLCPSITSLTLRNADDITLLAPLFGKLHGLKHLSIYGMSAGNRKPLPQDLFQNIISLSLCDFEQDAHDAVAVLLQYTTNVVALEIQTSPGIIGLTTYGERAGFPKLRYLRVTGETDPDSHVVTTSVSPIKKMAGRRPNLFVEWVDNHSRKVARMAGERITVVEAGEERALSEIADSLVA